MPLIQNLAVTEKPIWGCREPTRQEACSKFRTEFDESDVAPASSPTTHTFLLRTINVEMIRNLA